MICLYTEHWTLFTQLIYVSIFVFSATDIFTGVLPFEFCTDEVCKTNNNDLRSRLKYFCIIFCAFWDKSVKKTGWSAELIDIITAIHVSGWKQIIFCIIIFIHLVYFSAYLYYCSIFYFYSLNPVACKYLYYTCYPKIPETRTCYRFSKLPGEIVKSWWLIIIIILFYFFFC